jgi:hypothetical protein
MLNKDWSRHMGACLLLLLMLGGAACSKGPKDEVVLEAVKASLNSEPKIKKQPIEVAVANGEVTLTGEVSNDLVRLEAYKLVSQVDGVKKVIDEMDVKGKPRVAHKSKAPMSQAGAPTSVPAQHMPEARVVTIPEGTSLRVQMIDSVNSNTGQAGALYKASLANPITMGDQVIVGAGADVFIQLVSAKSAGKIKGSSELELALDHLVFQGKDIPLQSNSYEAVGSSRGKETATRAALGTGVGAAIGAIAGGGKGAAIGAAVGGGGAMGYQLLTHGKEIKVPSETKMDFKLAVPFQVVLPPNAR